MTVRVQEADFDTGAELDRLTRGNKRIGGLAVFVGLVREMHVREGLHREPIDALTLEHYPGMTEKALEEIEAEACRRWPREATLIAPPRKSAGDRIVLSRRSHAPRGCLRGLRIPGRLAENQGAVLEARGDARRRKVGRRSRRRRCCSAALGEEAPVASYNSAEICAGELHRSAWFC